MEMETTEGRTRWHFWRRCSLAQFGLCTGFFCVCMLATLVAWYYVLLAGLLLGMLWCGIRSRSARRPDSAPVSRMRPPGAEPLQGGKALEAPNQ